MEIQHGPGRANSKSAAIALALASADASGEPQSVHHVGTVGAEQLWEVRNWKRGCHLENSYRAIVHPDGGIDYAPTT